ncbi:MAG TPA: NAD(P)-dependent oxidoreductase, partial [Caulobacteraceae bacterium]|nr:NAD(P)-dependent oxidoreductase [Caulobacteraceae bacterium]
AAAAAARAAGTPVNVTDQPDLCDFYTPAVIDRGQVVAAVGTAGASPLLAAMIRTEVESRIPEGAGRVAALMSLHQQAIRDAFPDLGDRRAFLRALMAGPAAEAAMAGDMDEASRRLLEAVEAGPRRAGQVTIVLVAGRPDLIPVRAVEALAAADAVLAGPDGHAVLDRHARRDAPRLAGAAEVLAEAGSGRSVAVVAPSADPALVADLAAVGVPVEILAPAPGPR